LGHQHAELECGYQVYQRKWSRFGETGNVKSQHDRGLFYQNFTLGLLESKVCVGWHWFKYGDNDPSEPNTDPSNRDANKGIVNFRYESYPALLEAMQMLNERVYSLVNYFDRTVSK
jgi:hypothetical protein